MQPNIFKQAPNWLRDVAPDAVKAYLEGTAWYVIEGVFGLIALLVLLLLVRSVLRMFSGGAKKGMQATSDLEEHLAEYPPLKPSTGDRQLRVEGVPCRLRLLAIAPAGTASEIDEDAIPDMLEKLVTGMGAVFEADKPRVPRIWPIQISYQGFAKHFHRNTIIPEEKGEPTPWIIVAGRAKLSGKQQFMIGMAFIAIKPTTVGRRTYDSHEWVTALKVRVRD